VATKADVQSAKAELKADIAAVSADLRNVESSLKADIAAVRASPS
jgi:hypothetical protein